MNYPSELEAPELHWAQAETPTASKGERSRRTPS
jgi:hypothetical protein